MQAAPRQMSAVGLGKGFPAPHSAMHPLMEGCRVLRPHRGSGCCVPPFGPPVLHGGTISQGPCPSWCLCAEFPLDFLPHLARVRSLRRAGLSCLSWLQAALGIQCSAMPLLPSHPALLSAFSCPPCCVLGPGFISGVEMGPGKSEKSVWAAGPCLWCPFLAGAAQGAAQGLSRHSQQGSSLGIPSSPQSTPQAQDSLCTGPMGQRHSTGSANPTPLFFSLKVHYQTAASYGGARLSLPHYRTAQPSFTTPSPVPSSLLALSLPWLALGACLVTPLSL